MMRCLICRHVVDSPSVHIHVVDFCCRRCKLRALERIQGAPLFEDVRTILAGIGIGWCGYVLLGLIR